MLIKPDAVRDRAVGRIIARVEAEGFALRGLRMVRLLPDQAEAFYHEHAGKPFYPGLVAFMASGPTVALLLEREDAVSRLRAIIGATDSRLAAPGTIRAEFGTDNHVNAVHASDSVTSAKRETAFFFGEPDTIPLAEAGTSQGA